MSAEAVVIVACMVTAMVLAVVMVVRDRRYTADQIARHRRIQLPNEIAWLEYELGITDEKPKGSRVSGIRRQFWSHYWEPETTSGRADPGREERQW